MWRKPSLGLKPALLWWSPPLTACPLQDASSQDTAGKGLEALDPARGKAKSRATLDELLDTLKLLEQEPEPLPRPRAYHKDKYAWIDEVTVGPSHVHSRHGAAEPKRKPTGLLPALVKTLTRQDPDPSGP